MLANSQSIKIKIETVVSVVLLCLAVVLNSAEMKPVKWREWASKQERENSRYIHLCINAANFSTSNIIENRPGFIDIRAKRKEFLAKKGLDAMNMGETSS